jgi:hypothetical protein
VSLRLVASSDGVFDASDALVAEAPAQRLKLAPGRSRAFRLKPVAFPAVPDGDYQLLAVADAGGAVTEQLETNNAAALASPVRIAGPFVDVAVTAPALTGRNLPGKKAALVFNVVNNGNTLAVGTPSARVRLTTNPADPSSGVVLNVPVKLKLKPGVSRPVRGKLVLPTDLPPGNYFVVVEGLDGTPWTDTNTANDSATSDAAFAVLVTAG